MKKIQNQVKKNRTILILSSVLTASAVFLPGCDLFAYKQPFPDAYYDNNFIEAIGFDVFEGDNSTIPAAGSDPVTGKWDFAYRYTDWDGYSYMTRTPAGVAGDYPTVPSGLSATAPVYRLELVNLINGGDFEGATPFVDWTKDAVASPVSSFSILPGAPEGINNKSLKMNLTNFLHFVRYDYLHPVYGLEIGKNYQIDFKWKTEDNTVNPENIYMNKEASLLSFNPDTLTASLSFPAITDNYLNLGSSAQGLILTVDDITIKKNIFAQLRLLLKISETTPPLKSLLYRFSFWVYEDPSVGSYTSPYHLDTLKADMQPVLNNSTLSTTTDPYTYDYNPDSTGWTKMTVEVNNGNLQFLTVDPEQPVLELIVNLDDSLPGRVLIAQPELRCYPDGY